MGMLQNPPGYAGIKVKNRALGQADVSMGAKSDVNLS